MSDISKFTVIGKKIVGAGLNYKSILKARGLPIPEKPVFFLKPSSSYITEGQPISIPEDFDVHHEVELGVIIKTRCKNVPVDKVKDVIGGYCLALDLTAMNFLGDARKAGNPWTLGKGFDTGCPVGPFIAASALPDPSTRIFLSINGKMKQDSTLSDMVFSPEQLISYLSRYMTLEPADLILTGSPAGTGPIAKGDEITCGLGNDHTIQFVVK